MRSRFKQAPRDGQRKRPVMLPVGAARAPSLRERDVGVSRVGALNGFGVETVVYKHPGGQRGQEVEKLVIQIGAEYLRRLAQHPVGTECDQSPRPIPEMERADRIRRVDVIAEFRRKSSEGYISIEFTCALRAQGALDHAVGDG